MQLLEKGAADRLREDVDRAYRRSGNAARGRGEDSRRGLDPSALRTVDGFALMAITVGPTLSVRVLLAVGDNEPIELGAVEAPLKARPLPNGERGVELVFSTRKWRRQMRRFFRAAARASR